MKRRQFSLGLLAGVSATALTSLPTWAQATDSAQPVTLRENENYWPAKTPMPNDAPEGKIQVIQFFAYSCSHCYTFENLFNAWEKTAPSDAYIQRMPVSFRTIVEPHARIYYTLEALNRLDLHETVFQTFQVQRIRLITENEIRSFFASHGVNADEAMQIYNAFGTQAKVNRANQIVNAYGIEGTPAMGIAGKYWVMGAGEQTLRIAEALIARAKAELAPGA